MNEAILKNDPDVLHKELEIKNICIVTKYTSLQKLETNFKILDDLNITTTITIVKNRKNFFKSKFNMNANVSKVSLVIEPDLMVRIQLIIMEISKFGAFVLDG